MKKAQFIKPKLEIVQFTTDCRILTTSGILDNNTDQTVPDDFFGDGEEF